MMVDSGDKPASEETPSLNAAIGKSEKFSELGPFSLLFDGADVQKLSYVSYLLRCG